VMAALLLGRTFRIAEAWGVLLGISMLTIGTASRLGLAGLAAMFVMGVALSALSPRRAEIIEMVAPTERPVMLPALLLAGASIDVREVKWLPWIVAAAVASRLAAKWLVGLGLLAVAPAARPAGPRMGLGLASAGALAMSIGLAFTLRFPGPIGSVVLASAAAVTLVGEIVGPASLRACLRRAGEIPDTALKTPTPAAPPPSADAEGPGPEPGAPDEAETEMQAS
jgi:Kef-type K+ transport system membrane component KefB